MIDGGSPLAGRRMLLVEDEPLIVMLLEDMLSDMDVESAATADSVAGALELIETLDGFDGAILDMNLRGKSVEPVADALLARNIPFVFASGYGSAGHLTRHANAPVLAKPFLRDALEEALTELLGVRN